MKVNELKSRSTNRVIGGSDASMMKSQSKESVDVSKLQKLIEQKAYELYAQRGLTHGNDWSDWFEAEKIIRSKIKRF